jgi:hypothetical protein
MTEQVPMQAVLENLKAELGNLVFQLAVKEAIIKQLKADAQKKTQPESDRPA